MSKSVASVSEDDHETLETSRKRGGDDEGEEDGDEIIEGAVEPNSTTLTTVETAPAATDQFMHTPEFRRHFVDFVPVDALMALRSVTKGWNDAADALIDEGVESSELMVHDGMDFSSDEAYAKWERRQLVTRDLIFLLNITKVGDCACKFTNLIVVDIPEGVHTIGEASFACCRKLTTVSFPTTLKSIGWHAFLECTSLDNVDLLHTNLEEIGAEAFFFCSELKTMTIPDSLQTLGLNVFRDCSKLVPENIDVSYNITTATRLTQRPKLSPTSACNNSSPPTLPLLRRPISSCTRMSSGDTSLN
ncbi:hypothetical protein TL16_g13050 [Triparma laevis f. inornata]|uniref:Uncharacterized protein n=1 Tax=Triparma laevis f. inornata TaxID=1714386 RepID=A0A9W7EX35_9STRA|nr:hypothetical protein TL16_g13050 [Triparma laevis f. inornata]